MIINARAVIKCFSGGTGIIFKGSGFYVTDYKKTSSGDTSTPNISSPTTTPTTPVATPATSTDK